MRWQDQIQTLGLVVNRAPGLSFANSIQALKDGLYEVSPKDEKSQALVWFKENYNF